MGGKVVSGKLLRGNMEYGILTLNEALLATIINSTVPFCFKEKIQKWIEKPLAASIQALLFFLKWLGGLFDGLTPQLWPASHLHTHTMGLCCICIRIKKLALKQRKRKAGTDHKIEV